jgi:hypothetical protein|tara:strand:- start:159 stop:413 length:255 start_codon:yes stop_codon:yes gene_type:complete
MSKKTYKKGPAVNLPKFDSEGNIIKTIKTESQKKAEKIMDEEIQKKLKGQFKKYKEKGGFKKGGYKNGGKLKNRYPGGGRHQHD